MPIRERIRRLFKNASLAPHHRRPEDDARKKRQHSKTGRGVAPPGGPASAAAAAKARFAGTQPRRPKLGRDGKPKIELYKPHEVPPSKYRGPFDPAHMQKLAEYSIPQAARERPLSLVSQLSPTDIVVSAPLWRDQEDTATRFTEPDETLDARIQLGRPSAGPTPVIASTSPDRESNFTFFTQDGTETRSSGTLFTSYTTEDESLHRLEWRHSRNISSPLSQSDCISYRE